MTPQIDAGGTLAFASTPIGPDENAVELEHRLGGNSRAARVRRDPQACRRHDRAGAARQKPRHPGATLAQGPTARSIGRAPLGKSRIESGPSSRGPAAIRTWLRDGVEPLRIIVPGSTPSRLKSRANPARSSMCGKRFIFDCHRRTGRRGPRSAAPPAKRQLSAGEFLRGYPIKVGGPLRKCAEFAAAGVARRY